MTVRTPARSSLRFAVERPGDLRKARPWHRLAYIVRVLPIRLETLAAELQVPADGRVLDYGCAEQPYRGFFGPDVEFVGADLEGNPHATLTLGDGGVIPAPANSFDAVLSTQVLEHVAEPHTYLAECMRVLRPGGRLLLSTHGIMVYHPDPVDWWRWTSAGLRRIAEEAGFEIVRLEGIMGLAATGLQLVQDSFYHRLPRRLRPLLALCLQSLIALVDRLEPRQSRDVNALVFAIVAEKPASSAGV
jgi:SAM-dependent methyltransferase